MPKTQQAVDIQLYQLQLNSNPNDYFAQVRNKGTIDNEGIANLIKEEGSEYQIETIVEILNRADRIKLESLAEGYNIKTGLIHARLTVTGIFTENRFNSSIHQLKGSLNLTRSARDFINATKVTVLGKANVGIVVDRVVDSLTEQTNSVVTPGNVLNIYGDKLRVGGIDEFETQVGVYFVNQADQTRVKVIQYVQNENKHLIVMVPNLAQGNYRLEVVSQLSDSQYLKTVRQGTLDEVLEVL